MDYSKDNCATALTEIPENENLKINDALSIEVNRKIPFGHKFAIKDVKKGEYVIKYGQIIGVATIDIKSGDWVHTKNIVSKYMEEAKINE